METLTDIEIARLRDLHKRIRDGEYDADRMPDTRLNRLAYAITDHMLAILSYAVLLGAAILFFGVVLVFSQPW